MNAIQGQFSILYKDSVMPLLTLNLHLFTCYFRLSHFCSYTHGTAQRQTLLLFALYQVCSIPVDRAIDGSICKIEQCRALCLKAIIVEHEINQIYVSYRKLLDRLECYMTDRKGARMTLSLSTTIENFQQPKIKYKVHNKTAIHTLIIE